MSGVSYQPRMSRRPWVVSADDIRRAELTRFTTGVEGRVGSLFWIVINDIDSILGGEPGFLGKPLRDAAGQNFIVDGKKARNWKVFRP